MFHFFYIDLQFVILTKQKNERNPYTMTKQREELARGGVDDGDNHRKDHRKDTHRKDLKAVTEGFWFSVTVWYNGGEPLEQTFRSL